MTTPNSLVVDAPLEQGVRDCARTRADEAAGQTDLDRRQRELAEALEKSSRELQLTLDATTEGIWKWELKENKMDFSPRYYTMLGYEPGEFSATYGNWVELIHPDDRDAALAVSHEWLRTRPDTYEDEFRLRTKSGGYRWIHAHARVVERDERGVAVRMIGFHSDITARRMAEMASSDYQRQLQSMAMELSMAEERERRELSIWLHDEITQTLAFATLKLEQAIQLEKARGVRGALQEVDDLLHRSIGDIRSLMAQLSPPILYELGLAAALENLADNMSRLMRLEVQVETDEDLPELSHPLAVFLYRAVRELLVNVCKHAGVLRAAVSIRRDGGRIRVTVRDEGNGMEPSRLEMAVKGNVGFGLFSIRERLHCLGGGMEVESRPGQGTSVSLLTPLADSSDAQNPAKVTNEK
ncbi:MAG: PAS domain-containing protein [Verrucomicrobiae bacterium]|nr:PAS domain-containing protein [Verrucomicrobiae bacterium]